MKKNTKNNLLNKDIESILIGLMIILICIIALLNKGPVGNFFTYIGIYLFGTFYFLIFVIAIIFGLLLIINKKAVKIHFSMRVLGGILVFFSCIIASSKSSSVLTLTNFTGEFSERIATVSSSAFVIDSIENLALCGGGFIGYLLKALLNTCITEIGTTIVYVILMITGIVLLLKDVIAYIIRFFINYDWKRIKKEKKNVPSNDNNTKENNVGASNDSFENKYLNPTEPVLSLNHNSYSYEEKEKEESQTYKNFETPEQKSEIEEIEELSIPQKDNKIKNYFADEVDEINETPVHKDYFQEEKPVSEPVESIKPFEESKPVISETPKENIPLEVKNDNKPVSEEPVEELKPELPPMKEAVSETIIVPKNEASAPKPIVNEIKPEVSQPVKENKTVVQGNNKPRPVPKNYVYPSFDLLKYHPCEDTKAINQEAAQNRLIKINKTFEQFKIGAQVISYTIGPSVTRFNVKMNEGVRVSTLSTVTNEISIALNGDKTVRVELIVEGRDTSSIEVGNVKANSVSFKECFEQIKDRTSPKEKLLIPLGKDIEGKVVTTSMDELPHLLVAGTTGSGKSVFVNTIIATFIMRNRPDELRLILVDPKKVEFSRYANLPHLLCPIITESREASAALAKLCEEMDDRYQRLAIRGASKISEYNEIAEEKGFEKMSSIVVVIDEFADLLSKNAKEINESVQRLCQKARAAGIYLIICTQRPSVNVITGDIKAVIPSRIALLVPQANDSRIILDETGAEALLGNGDMLCQIPKHSSLVRLQGAYVSGSEISQICDAIKIQTDVNYDPKFCNLIPVSQPGGGFQGGERKLEFDEELHEEAKRHVIETRIASTSNLQSYFQIGYARADHILNCLEQEGIVKRVNGNRRIVVAKEEDNKDEK